MGPVAALRLWRAAVSRFRIRMRPHRDPAKAPRRMSMATDEELRQSAIKAIKRKRDFWNHLIAYCIVNIFLVVIWYITGHGYFWPGWVLAGWGIGVAFNAWDAFGRSKTAISEDEIKREMDRQR
jgi:hypothetical protein